MFLGSFSSAEVEPLNEVPSGMEVLDYMISLDRELLSYKSLKDNNQILSSQLQDDTCIFYRAKIIMNLLEKHQNDVPSLIWSPNSSYFNLIEKM